MSLGWVQTARPGRGFSRRSPPVLYIRTLCSVSVRKASSTLSTNQATECKRCPNLAWNRPSADCSAPGTFAGDTGSITKSPMASRDASRIASAM